MRLGVRFGETLEFLLGLPRQAAEGQFLDAVGQAAQQEGAVPDPRRRRLIKLAPALLKLLVSQGLQPAIWVSTVAPSPCGGRALSVAGLSAAVLFMLVLSFSGLGFADA